jgi:hypothetical protein
MRLDTFALIKFKQHNTNDNCCHDNIKTKRKKTTLTYFKNIQNLEVA